MALRFKNIVRGTTRNIDVTFKKQNGQPHDLTGARVFFAATLEEAPADDSAAAINIDPVTVHTDPTNGKTRITLTSDDTDVAAGSYNVGVQAVLADGTVIEDIGRVNILQDYKKATV